MRNKGGQHGRTPCPRNAKARPDGLDTSQLRRTIIIATSILCCTC